MSSSEKKALRRKRKRRQLSKDVSKRRAWSIEEFSDRWGWGRNTTYNLIASGDLKTAKVGKRRIITVEAEADFAERMEKKAGA